MTIGQRISQYRKEMNLSQEQLGDKLGVSRQAVYKWESDLSLPDTSNLIELSKIFNIPLSEMIGEDAKDYDQKLESVSNEKGMIAKNSEGSKNLVIVILAALVIFQLFNNINQGKRLEELSQLVTTLGSSNQIIYPPYNNINNDKFNYISYDLESFSYENFEMSYRVIFSLKEQPVNANINVFIGSVNVDVEKDSNNVYNTLVTVPIGENKNAGIIVNDGETIETIIEYSELEGINTQLAYLMPLSVKGDSNNINMKFEWVIDIMRSTLDYDLIGDSLKIGSHTYNNITLIAKDTNGETTRVKLSSDIYDYIGESIFDNFIKKANSTSFELSIEMEADESALVTYSVGEMNTNPLTLSVRDLNYETEVIIQKINKSAD